MIKPTYFPFTYVPQWVAETLVACFKQFTIYQPSGRKPPPEMQAWIDANVMGVRVPVQTEDEALEKMAREFQAFAGLHDDSKNLETTVFRGRQGGIPCFSESAASRIASHVKKHGESIPAETDSHALFSAQVFLDFAQEFDRQSAELNRSLGVNAQQLGDLLKEIGGARENDLPASPLNTQIRVEDPGEYMVLERLKAWRRLFVMDPAESEFLVTSSPAVFKHLLESLPAAQKVIHSLNLPVVDVDDGASVSWRDSFLEQMKALIDQRGGSGGSKFGDFSSPQDQHSNVALTLYAVSGRGPAEIFSRVFEDQVTDALKSDPSVEVRTTLIGLIDRQPFDSENPKHP